MLLVAGLYNVLWGKTREDRQVADHDTRSSDGVEKRTPPAPRHEEKHAGDGDDKV